MSVAGHAGDVPALVRQWKDAKEALREADRNQTSARNTLDNTTKELGQWLVPSEAKDGERCGVWVGDEFFQAVRTGGSYSVDIRKRSDGRVLEGKRERAEIARS